MKKTILYDEHARLGARMVDFAGWEMPVQYQEGIIAEHLHTRKYASIFDICHMGEFRIKGKNAERAIDSILARPTIAQKTGTCRYNFLLSDKGTIMDDLIVYRLSDDEFYIVVNASTKDSDAERFRKLLPGRISFSDESDHTAKIDLQGPESANVLEKLGIEKKAMPKYYSWIKTQISGAPCLLSRTGYTGELGFEIYLMNEDAIKIWNCLLSVGNVKPAGLGARDTLRLEMGYPLYGHELNTETTPVEAGFGKILKLELQRNFPGSEILRNSQIKKKLVGIQLDGRRAARHGSDISVDGKIVGKISSGAFSPSLSCAVALGYLPSSVQSFDGLKIKVVSGKNNITGKIVELPFYKSGTARITL